MTLNDGFERTVADWLDEQAGHGMPGYLDEALARTTQTRQRPWWSSLERWLPVQSTARFAQAPRMVWLLVILGLVLALGTAILIAGSPKPLPSPFGPGAHGNVLYAGTDGDIYAIDTTTNVAHPLVTGSAADTGQVLSPDGTRMAFIRRDAGSATTSIVVANADGSGLRELSGLPEEVAGMTWSPDGTRLAVVGAQGLWIVGPDMAPTLVTPTDQFAKQLRLLRISAVATERSRTDLPLERFGPLPQDRGLRRPDGRVRSAPARRPDDRGSGAARPVTGRDQGRLFHPGDRSARDPRRRRSNRARPPRRLRWSRRRCATAMVARWDEARLRTHSRRGIPVDGRCGRWWSSHRDRSDTAGQDRRRRCPVLTGWRADPGVLQRRSDNVGSRPGRRSGTKLDYAAITPPTWQGLAH